MNSLFANKRVLLAPMAGVNDPVFRGICSSYGADLTYTEMISAKGLAYDNRNSKALLVLDKKETVVAVQLFGKDPSVLAEQARRLEERYGARLFLIDINMGCPARKIVSKGEGAALMKQPALAEVILCAVVEAVTLPVTVKFRRGWEQGEDIVEDFARRAESCGVAAVTVHGRFAQQFYHGSSDREVIARVRQAVAIPVIASGDVFSPADIQSYREDYGADAVMVARGARGNPWIFANAEPSLEDRVKIAHQHTVELARLFPHRLASMRRHVSWYFRGTPHAATIRRAAHDCKDLRDYERLFEQILAWR
jgi:nifR3 family TIM-barrel protein